MERQAKEDAIKRGLGSFGPQSAWLAGLMAPSSGITDTLGLYPADTSGSGEKLPSFGENIQNKQYLDALYQGLGLAGDAMYASTPLTGPLGILGGTALKGMGAVGKATKASKSLKSKKYGDYLYHITPTKNVKSIKERGLSPIETSNYTKGRALDDPYQEDPRVFAWTNPVDAMHFLNRMHGPIGTDNMDEFSMIRIRKTNGGKWEKDLALDPHMAYSNVDEIQKATGEKGLVSVQTGSYKGIDSDDIIDHIEIKDLQKELGDFIPSELVYPGQCSYTGVEYSDAVTDLMNRGGTSTDKASKLAKGQKLISQGKATAGTAKATEKLMEPTNIKSGTIVDVRRNLNSKIDDPELERFKVQTIHGVATKGGKATKAESSIGTGPALSYDASVTVRADEAPIELNVNQKARDQIASRTKPKFPMAAVRGEHAPTENFNPDLVLKFNPMKQNVFVDDSGYGVKAIKNGKATIVDNDVMVKLDNPESFRTIKAPDGSDVKIYDDIEYYDTTTLPKTENPSDVNVLPIKAYDKGEKAIEGGRKDI